MILIPVSGDITYRYGFISGKFQLSAIILSCGIIRQADRQPAARALRQTLPTVDAQCELQHLKTITKASKKDWHASAWYLERTLIKILFFLFSDKDIARIICYITAIERIEKKKQPALKPPNPLKQKSHVISTSHCIPGKDET